MLLIPKSIDRLEWAPLKGVFSLEVIKKAAVQSLRGLGHELKSSRKIPFTKLKKIDVTSSGGAGRVLFLLETRQKDMVLVMLRLKNDKKIGANMTIQNSAFSKVLDKNLDLILSDIEKGGYQEFSLEGLGKVN